MLSSVVSHRLVPFRILVLALVLEPRVFVSITDKPKFHVARHVTSRHE